MRVLFVIGMPGAKHFEGSTFKAFIPSLRRPCIIHFDLKASNNNKILCVLNIE